jgi:hypothetical protein
MVLHWQLEIQPAKQNGVHLPLITATHKRKRRLLRAEGNLKTRSMAGAIDSDKTYSFYRAHCTCSGNKVPIMLRNQQHHAVKSTTPLDFRVVISWAEATGRPVVPRGRSDSGLRARNQLGIVH